MKIIRTKGLIISLSVLLVVVVASWLFAGSVIKIIMTSQLSKANNAEVNIDSVSISLMPMSIEINNLQMTDYDQPETNWLQIKAMKLAVDTDSLLKSKFIVSDMTVEQLQLATPRVKKGEVFKTTDTDPSQLSSEGSDLSLGGIDLPDVNALIDKADLKSTRAFDDLEVQLKETQKSWDTFEENLNDSEKWKSFNTRYKKIKSDYKDGNVKERLEAIKALKKLQKEIKTETDLLSQQRKQLKADYDQLQGDYKTAKQAPSQDMQNLRDKLGFGENRVANISRTLFGDTASNLVTTALQYYRKVEPYIVSEETESSEPVVRDSGRYVTFKDANPEPGFLIKKAEITASLLTGDFKGRALNITNDQSVQNKTSDISLKAVGLKGRAAESIELIIDARKKPAKIEFAYRVSARAVNDYQISKSATLPLKLSESLIDMNADIVLTGKQLQAKAAAHFSAVKFTTGKNTNEKNFGSMLAAALEDVDKFTVESTAKGRLTSPSIKISSDLDNRVNKKLKARFNQIKQDYEKELKAKLDARFAEKKKSIDSLMKNIESRKRTIEQRQQEIQDKLNKYK